MGRSNDRIGDASLLDRFLPRRTAGFSLSGRSPHLTASLGGQKSAQVIRRLSTSQFPHRHPPAPYPCKESQ
ncbi:hypothetical protein HK24_00055 [Gluconobacter sp. DsW_058]|nr:hypothetical protein HK24_00055 [Gluconobacter sp. DsW_058]